VIRTRPLGLFQGYGIELEYMIVGRESLAVLPVADRILRTEEGEVVDELEAGPLCWSNELPLHVVELKTNGPVPSLSGLAGTFLEHVARVNRLLAPIGGRLMPSGMHPLMDPARETPTGTAQCTRPTTGSSVAADTGGPTCSAST